MLELSKDSISPTAFLAGWSSFTYRVAWQSYSIGCGVRPMHSHSPAALLISPIAFSKSICWYSESMPSRLHSCTFLWRESTRGDHFIL
jgi:hypothetical protein